MSEARSIKWVRLGQSILVTLVLIAVAVGIGKYLGGVVLSTNWQDAVRYTALGAVLIVILADPLSGLLLWVILEPYTRFWYLSFRLPPGIPDLSLGRLAVGVLAVVWVAQLASGRRKLRRPTGVEISMFLFCVMVIPSVFASTRGFNYSAQVLFDKFVSPFLVFVLAKNLYNEKTGLNKLSLALTIIALYLSFLLFHEQITGQPLFAIIGRTTAYTRSLRKIVSLLGNPGFMATVLGMIVPYALYRAVHERSARIKLFYSVLFVLTLAGNFFCYNRGAWLALAAGLLVMLLADRAYRRVLVPIMLVGVLVAVVYWQVISSSAIVTERLSNVSSVRFRVTMLEASRQMVQEHPVFGVGFEDFGYYYLLYGGHWETLAYDTPMPHNQYVLVLTTMGVLTFVPYVLIFLSMMTGIWSTMRRARVDKRIDKALLTAGWAIIVVYMVSAATVDLYVNVFTSIVFFAISGLIAGYISHMRSSPLNDSTTAIAPPEQAQV